MILLAAKAEEISPVNGAHSPQIDVVPLTRHEWRAYQAKGHEWPSSIDRMGLGQRLVLPIVYGGQDAGIYCVPTRVSLKPNVRRI